MPEDNCDMGVSQEGTKHEHDSGPEKANNENEAGVKEVCKPETSKTALTKTDADVSQEGTKHEDDSGPEPVKQDCDEAQYNPQTKCLIKEEENVKGGIKEGHNSQSADVKEEVNIEMTEAELRDVISPCSFKILRPYLTNEKTSSWAKKWAIKFEKFPTTGRTKHIVNMRAICFRTESDTEVINIDDDDDENEESPAKKQKVK